MAKRPTTIESKLTHLTRIVEKGFAALAHDMSHRPTNSDVAGIIENVVDPLLDAKLAPITAELVDVRRYLEALAHKVENTTEYRKEIDHALDRIAAIEKHLGINKKIAA